MISRMPIFLLLVVACFLRPPSSAFAQEMSKEEVQRQSKTASELSKQGKNAEAAALLERIRPSVEAIHGKDSEKTAHVLNVLALSYHGMGQHAKAGPLFQRSVLLYEAKLGKDHLNVATVLNNLALLYRDMSQFAKAEPLFQRSLQIREAKLGKEHVDVATSLYNLARLYRTMGQDAKAEPLYERSLHIREAKLGRDHPSVATSLSGLASIYSSTGEYAKAEPLLQRNLQIREAKHDKDHPNVATALNNLALLYRNMGHYGKAEPLYQRSLKIYEAKYDKNHLSVATSLSNLASFYSAMGEYAKAEPLWQRGLQIRETALGADHPSVALSLSGLASLYSSIGHYAKAEPLELRSLQIDEAKHGSNHPAVATSLNNLARLYRLMGQYAKAEPLELRGLQIREAKLGKDHPAVATSLSGLGALYLSMGQYAKAEPFDLRALQIREAKYDKDHPNVGTSLNNLALLYSTMRQYAKAEPLYQRSLQIAEVKNGKDHPNVATSLSNLASLYRNLRQHEKAEAYAERSLQIRQAKLGKDHPQVAFSLSSLAWSAAHKKDWTNAVDHIQKARQATANHLAETLPTLSEKEQLTLLHVKFERSFHNALSLGWSARKEGSTASAEWLLNGKAIAHQSLAEQQILARATKDPKAKQLIDSQHLIRAKLGALINRTPTPGLENEYQQEMTKLRASEQDLAQKVARAVGRPYRANPWVTLNELQAKLGPKTAFVDIARFPVFDWEKNKRMGPRYVAWITPPLGKGPVQLIDLGDAKAIDQLVAQTRKAMIDIEPIKKMGEPEALAALQKPLRALSAKVLFPLLATLEHYEEWIISPDGELWLTPWSALLLPTGEFAVEKHLIRHVVSGRDLVLELPKAKAGSAYLFADPDYDLSPRKVMAAATGVHFSSGSSLLGHSLRGSIGTRKITFEFQDNEVLLHDDEFKGAVVGKGTWKLHGNTLTLQTAISQFQGTIDTNEIRGQRTKRDKDGTVTRAAFRMETPPDDQPETRSTGLGFGTLAKANRLSGTAAEAAAVRPSIRQWLGQEPKVFLDGQASKAMVKSVKNPRVLTLATHGYFFPTQEIESTDRPGFDLTDDKRSVALIDQKGQAIENPLLRCGLLLAGCNKRAEAKGREDDGILTGLEIVGMNLNGCELVVLSACETGLGDVRNGEGVAGLRQAFQMAGAKSVLASLWQVEDRETAHLMNAFYGEIAKGRGQATALRAAQLQRIASRRDNFGAAHPFFWAAFALTSRGTD